MPFATRMNLLLTVRRLDLGALIESPGSSGQMVQEIGASGAG